MNIDTTAGARISRRAFFGILFGAYLAALFRLIPSLKPKPALPLAAHWKVINDPAAAKLGFYTLDASYGYTFYDLPSFPLELYPLAPRAPRRSHRDASRGMFRRAA